MTLSNLFGSERLPRKPYCSNNLALGLEIRSLAHAIRCRYIQPNEPMRRHWLVYDIDREGASEAWDGKVAEPNLSVINPVNGHGHLLYCLDVPVYLGGRARVGPIRYAAAVEAAYVDLLDADPCYVGLICKNPRHAEWKVIVGPSWGYDLGELAAWISPDQWTNHKRRKRTPPQGLGRNCTLFDDLRNWAYRHINKTAWVSCDAWHKAVINEAHKINQTFLAPLAFAEVKATAKSVGKWVWQVLRGSQSEYIVRTHNSEIQKARGRKSGEVRRKGSITECAPWEVMGISRSTWYRRQSDETRT